VAAVSVHGRVGVKASIVGQNPLGAVCLVFPSLGEAFGLPVLPEIAGDAAVMVDPANAVGLSWRQTAVEISGILDEVA